MQRRVQMIVTGGALASALALAACAPTPQSLSGTTDGKAPIGKNLVIALPAPAEFGRPVEVSQILTMTAHGRTFPLETRLSISRKTVSLVALDMVGRRAMTITWDGAALTYDRADWVPSLVDPGAVLADVYLLYAPEKGLSERLSPLGCTLADGKETREIVCAGETLLSARFGWPHNGRWNGTLQYANKSWGYDVEVQSTEMKR